MNPTTFILGMRTVSAALPYGKKLLDDEIKFIWLGLPESVKDLVTDQMWAYSCSQRLMDPNPDKELALHIQLLRYIYRIRDGQPAFDWGLKEDLPQRMAMGEQFHGLLPGCGVNSLPVLPASRNQPPEPTRHPAAREFRNGRFVDEEPVTNPVLAGLL